MRIAHLSRARGAADGGISLIVAEMSEAQRHHSVADAPTHIRWLAPPDNLAFELRQFAPDLVHVHGLWSAANRTLARGSWRPSVIAPQGMLDAWALAQSPCLKRAAWSLYEQRNLRRCAAVQALSAAEHRSIRAKGIRAPVAIIPNAVSLPNLGQALKLPPPGAGARSGCCCFSPGITPRRAWPPCCRPGSPLNPALPAVAGGWCWWATATRAGLPDL